MQQALFHHCLLDGVRLWVAVLVGDGVFANELSLLSGPEYPDSA